MSVGGWLLGELLGLEIESIGNSHRTFWAFRKELDEGGFEHPYAENIELLEGRVSESRYRVISLEAKQVLEDPSRVDVGLRPDEIESLREAYAEKRADCPHFQYASESVRSTTGIELEFGVMISDAGDREVFSPYEIRAGKGVNFDRCIELF